MKLMRASRKKVGGNNNEDNSRHNRQHYPKDTKPQEKKSQEMIKPPQIFVFDQFSFHKFLLQWKVESGK